MIACNIWGKIEIKGLVICVMDDDIVIEKGKGTAQIPWKNKTAGPILKLSLMKLVVAKGVHLRKGHNDVDTHWRILIGDLLRQPEWKFLVDQLPSLSAPLEARVFKDACNKIIDDVSKAMRRQLNPGHIIDPQILSISCPCQTVVEFGIFIIKFGLQTTNCDESPQFPHLDALICCDSPWPLAKIQFSCSLPQFHYPFF